MIKGIYVSSRSLEVQAKNFDSIANNLANINTTGYKRQLPFQEILSESGEPRVKQYTDFKQGELVSTGNPFDFGLSGEGYFALNTENGVQYTRNGKFTLSQDGFLINEQGYKVLGRSGEINMLEYIDQNNQDILVKSNGEIKAGDVIVDSIMVVKIDDIQQSARNAGLNLTTDESKVTVLEEEEFEIHQGYREESNINPIIEMESMIKINKDYEAAYKMMKYLDQSLGQANEMGKV